MHIPPHIFNCFTHMFCPKIYIILHVISHIILHIFNPAFSDNNVAFLKAKFTLLGNKKPDQKVGHNIVVLGYIKSFLLTFAPASVMMKMNCSTSLALVNLNLILFTPSTNVIT